MPRLRESCLTAQQQVSVRGQRELTPWYSAREPGKGCVWIQGSGAARVTRASVYIAPTAEPAKRTRGREPRELEGEPRELEGTVGKGMGSRVVGKQGLARARP